MSEDDLKLAREVCVGPQQFSESFMRAQADRDGARKSFDSVVKVDLPPEEAIATAFALARAETWLDALCNQCVVDRIATHGFVNEAARQTAAPGLVAAQARIQEDSPFRDTLLEGTGLIKVADYICRILVDGVHRGTGFLVRSDLVMTAGHVMTPPRPGDPPLVGIGGAAEPDAADRIEVLFDDKIELIAGRRSRKPRRFTVAESWLVARSAPVLGAGNVAAEAMPDYALIRLASAPLLKPGGLDLQDDDPFPKLPLLIVQHPAARPMCHANGIVEMPGPAANFFLHDVNTDGGSSGAPCFSTDFKVVGVHSGEVLGSNPRRNALLSIRIPAGVLAAIPQTAPAPTFLTQLTLPDGRQRAVVGRQETQNWLRDCLGGSTRRILAVNATAARKTGMSFTGDLFEALLPRDQHRIVRLSAEQFRNASPQEFARQLLQSAGGAATLSLPAQPDANSTRVSWLRRDFVTKLLDQLDTLRAGRLVWLILDDLRLALAEGNGLRECLDLMYAEVAIRDWLRIALLGYGATPAPEVADHLHRVDLQPIAPEELNGFLQARIAALGSAEARNLLKKTFDPLWGHVGSLPEINRLDFAADLVTAFMPQLQ